MSRPESAAEVPSELSGNLSGNKSGELPVIFLMGPTGTGKTELAVQLAERYPIELISVDSALVYRGLNIGSAKPDAATLARAPHRLIDIREPSEPYSAGDFRRDALAAIAEIQAKGNIPLLVGGTMLYFRALSGLDDLPNANPKLRAEIEAQAAVQGWTALHAQLEQLNSAVASKIHPNDAQRIQRALELQHSGAALGGDASTHSSGGLFADAQHHLPWPLIRMVTMVEPRSHLHERLAQRLKQMFAAGFVDEVRQLREQSGLHAELPAMRAVGYRQVWSYLDGAYDLAECQQRALFATRQLAKRQITWLRREQREAESQQAEIPWLNALAPTLLDQAAAIIEPRIKAFL